MGSESIRLEGQCIKNNFLDVTKSFATNVATAAHYQCAQIKMEQDLKRHQIYHKMEVKLERLMQVLPLVLIKGSINKMTIAV